jgi:hypothetical protein
MIAPLRFAKARRFDLNADGSISGLCPFCSSDYESELSGAEPQDFPPFMCVFSPAFVNFDLDFADCVVFRPFALRRDRFSDVLQFGQLRYPVAQRRSPVWLYAPGAGTAVVMMQNISNFTIGLLRRSCRRRWRRRYAQRSVRPPMIYV